MEDVFRRRHEHLFIRAHRDERRQVRRVDVGVGEAAGFVSRRQVLYPDAVAELLGSDLM